MGVLFPSGFLLSRRVRCFIALTGLLWVAATAAAADQKTFNIPAQSLSSALSALAAQADISIGLAGVNLTNRTSHDLAGYDNVEEALRRLLIGTGLSFQMIDPDTWRIFERPAATEVAFQKPVVPISLPPIEQITVTATKRPMAIQLAPLSIAAVTGRTLSDYGLHEAHEVTSFVAGLSAANQGPGRSKFIVRGLSDGPFIGNTQSTVSVYLDEMRATFNAPDPDLLLLDIDRVEVIRGPQGTLYGAGSIGGLIRIITRAPVLGALEARGSFDGSLSAAADPSGMVEATINLPLISDVLALRTVAYTKRAGGYINNSFLGHRHVNDTDTSGFRSAAVLRISQDWRLRTSVTFQSTHLHDTQYFDAAMPRFSRANFMSEPGKNDFLSISAGLDGGLNWADLTSTTSWISQDVATKFDASQALPLLLRMPPAPTSFNQESRYRTINHETRLVSLPGGNLQWLGGIFFSHRNDASFMTLRLLSQEPAGIFYSKNRHDKGTEIALFGEATYKLNERLSVSAGLRLYRGDLNTVADNSELIDVGPTEAFGANSKFGATPRAEITFQVDPNNLFYAQVSQGFRLGGINIASRIPNPTSTSSRRPVTVSNFESDRLWNFEVGSKSAFFDQTLTLNATAFYAIWNNMQADLIRPNGLPVTANLGNVRNYGLEAEGAFALNEHVRFLANLSWANPVLTERNMALASLSDNRLPITPKLSATLAAQVQTQLTQDYLGFVNAKYELFGRARLTNDSGPMSAAHTYHTLNLRAGIQHQEWKLTAYVNNVTGNASNTYAFGNPFSLGQIMQEIPLRPRTVGLKVAWAN